MVNNHGDRKSPIPGVVGPLTNGYKWPFHGLYMGVTNHLQVLGDPPSTVSF